MHSKINLPSSSNSLMIDPCKDKLQVLNEQETLTGLQTQNLGHGFLVRYIFLIPTSIGRFMHTLQLTTKHGKQHSFLIHSCSLIHTLNIWLIFLIMLFIFAAFGISENFVELRWMMKYYCLLKQVVSSYIYRVIVYTIILK